LTFWTKPVSSWNFAGGEAHTDVVVPVVTVVATDHRGTVVFFSTFWTNPDL